MSRIHIATKVNRDTRQTTQYYIETEGLASLLEHLRALPMTKPEPMHNIATCDCHRCEALRMLGAP